MKHKLLVLFILVTGLCAGQGTWYGEIAFSAGGGTNDIFRFEELYGSGSVNGTGAWSAGIDFRRLFGEHFSLETGVTYSGQYYLTGPAPMIQGEDLPGSFGLISVPVMARVDFLKIFFADAGPLFSVHAGNHDIGDMTGLGASAGAGIQYNFKSDFFLRIRAFAAQYTLLHFMPDDHPRTLLNAGATISAGYRFIRLGKCNCPEGIVPRRRFY